MNEELTKLLSCLWTDANMALDNKWNRSDDGFKDQITLIERFSNKYNISLKDMSKV